MLLFMPESSKWSFLWCLPSKILWSVLSPVHATYPVHLVSLDLNTFIHTREIVQIIKLLITYLLQSLHMLSLLGSNFFSMIHVCCILYSSKPVRHNRAWNLLCTIRYFIYLIDYEYLFWEVKIFAFKPKMMPYK